MMFEQGTEVSPFDDEANYQLFCFICVQPICAVDNNDSGFNRYSLVGILNHLNIKPAKLRATLGNGSLTDGVPLCDKCSKVVEKLSGLCKDLEEVKLKIGYFLSELDQLIVLEEKDQTQANESLQMEEYHRDQLKRKLKDKCSYIMEGHTCRVVVSKLELDTGNMEMETEYHLPSSYHQIPKWEVTTESEDDDNDEYAPDEEDDQYEGSDCDSGDELEEQNTAMHENETEPAPTCQEAETSENSSAAQRKQTAKMYSCSECQRSFAIKPKLVEHSMVFHPEKYFPPSAYTTSPTSIKLTPAQNNMYSIHLLNTEIDYCEKPDGYKCIYCGVTFKRNRYSILMHLIKKHQDILRRELIQLQKDKSVDEIKQIVKMPVPLSSSHVSSLTNSHLVAWPPQTQEMRQRSRLNLSMFAKRLTG